ncbi:hypothetical protein Hanom_Chr01g00092191 [Helianthus anomalus]
MSPASVYHESRITRTIIFQDKRNQDRNGKVTSKSNGLDVISFTFTSPISRSTDMINRNSLSSATGGGSLSTLLDQQLRELTAMSPASVYHESRITRTIIFQDKRNQDGTIYYS